jgi:hypothetical protein
MTLQRTNVQGLTPRAAAGRLAAPSELQNGKGR